MSINLFDDIALEEALRLREKGVATEVVAMSAGPDPVQEQLRAALALATGWCMWRPTWYCSRSLPVRGLSQQWRHASSRG